jgi:hypothetical protein
MIYNICIAMLIMGTGQDHDHDGLAGIVFIERSDSMETEQRFSLYGQLHRVEKTHGFPNQM